MGSNTSQPEDDSAGDAMDEGKRPSRREELGAFLLTSFIIIPGLAVAFVGAYGFAIWIYQIIFGPPGPPA